MNHQTDSLQEDKATSHEQTLDAGHTPMAPSAVATVGSPESSDAASENAAPELQDNGDISRQLPIPPASEPKQYRAIGLIYGKYIPSEEQFTRGELLTENDLSIDSVLLGRVMSLVKKHIDLEKSHLWVVYPRTRNKDQYLHAQIVGVWEPEKLNRPLDEIDEQVDDGDNTAEPDSVVVDELDDASPESDDSSSELPSEASVGIESTTESDVVAADLTEADSVEIDVVAEATIEAKTEALSRSDVDADVDSDHSNAESVAVDAAESSDESTSPDLEISDSEAQMQPLADHEKPLPPFLAGDEGLLRDGYFSIRGEVVKATDDTEEITVKIRQAPRKGTTQQRSFN
ncbi:MAG: hypothetical protein AAFR31_10730, partial [Cyanobacteria bacterium J06627_8]